MRKSKTRTQGTIAKPSRSTAGSLLRDPALFARIVLGADLWQAQREILTALGKRSRVAVKACHASGKSYAIAIAVLWWLTAHRDGIVVTTAPTWLQVEKVIWGEIKSAVLRSLLYGKLKFPVPTQTELRLGPQNYAIGLSTDDSSRFQGFHSGHVLIVLDEAPGVRAEVYEAVEGIRAGGQVRVLALGNPTVTGGPFYGAFTANRASWRTFTINAFDTPNLQGLSLESLRLLPKGLSENESTFEYRPRPYLVTRRWVYEKLWEWGEDSPLWQSRVLGSFPEQSEDSLISLRWLEAARESIEPPPGKKLMVGIDVAGSDGGAETFAVVRQGGQIIAMEGWTLQDPLTEVNKFLYPFKNRIDEVNIDTIGVGLNFKPRLEALGYPCNGVNVGEASDDSDIYLGVKAQLYWRLRELFEAGEIHGLTDELAISQLSSIRWKSNLHGKIVIESKADLSKRGIKSPDRAEALMLAFADRTPGISRYYEELSEARAAREKDPSMPESEPDTELADVYEAERRRQQNGGDAPERTYGADPLPGYSNICQKCGQPINGTGTDIGAKRWHLECFGK